MDSFNDAELTQEELEEALRWAINRKDARMAAEELKARQEANRKALTGKVSAAQLDSFMRYRAATIFNSTGEEGKTWDLDAHNRAVYELLVLYFAEDREFISAAVNLGVANPSLSKGLLLAGNYGTGKTMMMKLFSKNQRQVFHVTNAKYIADGFQENGQEFLEQFAEKYQNASNDSSAFFQPYAGLCIDDLGTEEFKNHYGNKKNVLGDVIEIRYAKNNCGTYLHATTNLNIQELNDFYGGRVMSRMREIFNTVLLLGPDRRK